VSKLGIVACWASFLVAAHPTCMAMLLGEDVGANRLGGANWAIFWSHHAARTQHRSRAGWLLLRDRSRRNEGKSSITLTQSDRSRSENTCVDRL
jgi:hypothetical protein